MDRISFPASKFYAKQPGREGMVPTKSNSAQAVPEALDANVPNDARDDKIMANIIHKLMYFSQVKQLFNSLCP